MPDPTPDIALEKNPPTQVLPLPWVPPTQDQIDAAIAKLDQPPTPAEKLAAAGLTIADLKALLGLS